MLLRAYTVITVEMALILSIALFLCVEGYDDGNHLTHGHPHRRDNRLSPRFTGHRSSRAVPNYAAAHSANYMDYETEEEIAEIDQNNYNDDMLKGLIKERL